MKNLKISMKQLVGFGIVIILAIAIGVVGVIGMTSLSDGLDSMYTAAAPLAELGNAREYFQIARALTWESIVYASKGVSDAEMMRIETELLKAFDEFDVNMNVYGRSITTDDAQYLFDDVMSYFDNIIKSGFSDVVRAARQGLSTVELVDMLDEADAAADRVTGELDELFYMRDAFMEETNIINKEQASMLMVIIYIVIGISIAIAVFIGIYISKIISSPLKVLRGYMNDAGTKGSLDMTPEEARLIPIYATYKDEIGETLKAAQTFFNHVQHIAQQLEKIAAGDLTVHVEVLSDEDILGNSLQSMEDNLNDMFGNINSSTVQVSTGAKQVADGAQSLAQGSTEQAASVQELSASINEIAGKTKENAEMADRAANLATSIMQNAEKGNKQMDDMMAAVREINQASQNISKVIKAIDDIAFQTNILALNAAVEAARAGQHGKGFAVVAEEVRNLAAKSASAAKETGDMIQNSMEKAELGSRIAGETAESLTEIVTGITESSALIGDIARSSEEQSLGISQVNTGIDQVAQVVQQNSATAQQSAAASQQMSAQSTVLQELVAQFKIKDVKFSGITSHEVPASHQLEAPHGDYGAGGGNGNGSFGKY